jgi:hypothetical protein
MARGIKHNSNVKECTREIVRVTENEDGTYSIPSWVKAGTLVFNQFGHYIQQVAISLSPPVRN